MGTSFYRLVMTDPPTRDEFLSYEALGRPLLEDTPEARRKAKGISVNATPQQAAKRARTVPSLKAHAYIAELHIPDGAPVAFEKTGSHGHHTLWGDPDVLLGCVVSVVRVDGVQ